MQDHPTGEQNREGLYKEKKIIPSVPPHTELLKNVLLPRDLGLFVSFKG